MPFRLFFVFLITTLSIEVVTSLQSRLNHRHRRGFRSAVADRIAYGFGKRTQPTFSDVSSVLDMLNRNGISKDAVSATKESGVTVLELANIFRENPQLLIDYISEYLDSDGDGEITLKELTGVITPFDDSIQ